MRKISSSIIQGGMMKTAAILAAFIACLAVCGGEVLAAFPTDWSAGNTIIRNAVSVSYNDASNNPQTAVNAYAEITVTTVNAAPNIKSVTPSPGNTGATGATQVYAVEIVTNSNGPGTISLSAADGTPNNITLSGTSPLVQAPGSVFLGATVIDPSDAKIGALQNVANGASITFNIPNDGGIPTDSATTGGAFGNSSVNALSVNDFVYLYNGTTYFGKFQVTAVVDNASGPITAAAVNSAITLQNVSGAPASFTPAYGWMIVETKPLNVTVTQGLVTIAANPASWVTTMTGSMGGVSVPGTPVTTNAASGLLTVTKYVRNHTVAVAGASPITPPINGGGVTFYQTGVSGKPGDIMEYLYVITNTGTGVVKAVVATDAVPVYTTLRSSSGLYGANNLGGATGTFAVARRSGNATDQPLKIDNTLGNNATAWGKSTGTTAGSTMTYYIGNNSTSVVGGDIAAGEIAYVIYQLRID